MDIFQRATENDLSYIKMHLTHLDNVDDKNKNLLHYAVLGSAHDVIDFLLENHIDVNKKDDYGESPLFDCARKGKIDIAKKLINYYADVNITNKALEQPIHLAAQKGNIEMLKLLIDAKAQKDRKTAEDKLPIHYAIMGGQSEALKYLIEETNESWFLKDAYGNTLLHHATKTTNIDVIELLINQNLDPNALNSQFETPIFNAIRFGSTETIRLLLANEAYLDIKNRRYETPIDTAIIFNKKDIYVYLQDYMKTPKYERLIEKQALSVAVLNRDHLHLRQLIQKSVPMKKNRLHKTALDYAKEYNLALCIGMLKDVELINGDLT